jgi:hypothetical protein
MAKATKFTPDLFPPPTPENIAKYAPAKLWVNYYIILYFIFLIII